MESVLQRCTHAGHYKWVSCGSGWLSKCPLLRRGRMVISDSGGKEGGNKEWWPGTKNTKKFFSKLAMS